MYVVQVEQSRIVRYNICENSFVKHVKISYNFSIGENMNHTFVIAEIGINHNGNIDLAKERL